MKIIAISDTHSYHNKLVIPEGDVLIHAGDISWRGELPIIASFADWLKELPIKHKIVICGNHELGIQSGYKREQAIKLIKDSGAHYLEDNGVEIDGIHFWGSPATPWFHDWEWNYERGEVIAAVWKKIPENTNVLITHGPPYMILDEAPRGIMDVEHVGCEELTKRIESLPNLKAHIFGHIHHSYGTKQVGPCLFVNASSCTEAYKPINPPLVIEV
jgi:Icc-related predicted phosphoesterase